MSITVRTTFTVFFHFEYAESGPCDDRDQITHILLNFLPTYSESKRTVNAIELLVFDGNAACSPYFEAVCSAMCLAERIEKEAMAEIIKYGGRIL